MTVPTTVARLWTAMIRLCILVLLEGFAARLTDVRHVAGRPEGYQLLLGVLAIAALLAWPALGASAVVSILDGDPQERWRFQPALKRALAACLPCLFYFGGPLIALGLRLPVMAPHLAALASLYCVITATTGCLLARGVAPWGPTGRRLLQRTLVIYTLGALLVMRQWQPEDTFIQYFPAAGTLVFPFAKDGRHTYASANLLVAPAHPLPAIKLHPNVVPVGALVSLVLVLVVSSSWKHAPSEGAPQGRHESDLLATLLAFTGCLIVTSQGLCYLNQLNAFAQVWAYTVGEMFMLVALLMALAELAPRCSRRSYPLIEGALCCFHGAATMGTDLFWYTNSIISAVWISSFVTAAFAAAHVFRWFANGTTPAATWAAQLLFGTPLISAILLTDATFYKLQLRNMPLLVGFWCATKVGVCALALFVAWYLPQHLASPSRP